MKPVVIANKAALASYFDTTIWLKQDRKLLGNEWPQVRAEALKQVRCEGRRPPPYGTDWAKWLRENLRAVINEATEIVL